MNARGIVQELAGKKLYTQSCSASLAHTGKTCVMVRGLWQSGERKWSKKDGAEKKL
jgi:hypothetical protein